MNTDCGTPYPLEEIFEDCRDLAQSAVDGHNAIAADAFLACVGQLAA